MYIYILHQCDFYGIITLNPNYQYYKLLVAALLLIFYIIELSLNIINTLNHWADLITNTLNHYM